MLQSLIVLYNKLLQKSQNKTTLSALDFKINRMIKGFKTNMKSHLKDGEEISIDSVIWYIEASLNETYARADNSKEQIWMDSSFVTISLTGNNTVLLSSINDAYTELVSDLSDHYHSISGEKSFFRSIRFMCRVALSAMAAVGLKFLKLV